MWLWALQSPLGSTLSLLSGARSRAFRFRRTSTPEATFELDLQHDDAYVLDDALAAGGGGMPVLRCFRLEEQDDGSELVVCRFAGIFDSMSESASAGTNAVTFAGAFDVFEGRVTDALFARGLAPAADVAVDLITATAAVDGATGIVIGDVELTEPRDVTYEPRKRIADGVLDLADAFDFEVVPLADTSGQGADLGRFDAWVRQGIDRPEAVFGYGAGTVGNCDDATRTTQRPRNRVYVTGDEGLVGFAESPVSVLKHGVWAHVEAMSDVINASVLDARARALLQPDPIRTVTFTPDPTNVDGDGTAITPRPWLDYWLGDTVRVSVRKGSFSYDGSPRIDGIDLTIDDEGNESGHTIAVTAEGDS